MVEKNLDFGITTTVHGEVSWRPSQQLLDKITAMRVRGSLPEPLSKPETSTPDDLSAAEIKASLLPRLR
ncbi:MAG: hypothetical protein Q7R49_01590 [Candidatus Daviesbacteria bacterium]|nr:hypothetical protein [Candidatus Daviesbacteria bacterium]